MSTPTNTLNKNLPSFEKLKFFELDQKLFCPECKAKLNQKEELLLKCSSCDFTFPITNGVLEIFSKKSFDEIKGNLNTESGVHMNLEYKCSSGDQIRNRSGNKLFDWLRPPDLLYHPDPMMKSKELHKLFFDGKQVRKVLNIGGGPTRYSPHEIIINIGTFPNVDVVTDAHNIPFEDNSFDTIICNAVLEHVRDATKVISEIRRLCRPGGFIYIEMPFIFFFHAYPNDYRRFTRRGLLEAFPGFEEQEINITNGPTSALLQTANIYFQMFIPQKPRHLRKCFNGLFRWILFSFKYLDIWLSRHSEAELIAGGFSLLARKTK